MLDNKKGSKLGRPYSSNGLSKWTMAFWIARDKHLLKSDFFLSHFWNVGAAAKKQQVKAGSAGLLDLRKLNA
jgi:hypothetical protein